MFLHLSVILFAGGGLPQCMLGYPQEAPPPGKHPPGSAPPRGTPQEAHPLGSTHPPRSTPPRKHTPGKHPLEVHSLGSTTPRKHTPPEKHTPPGSTPPWEAHPPPGSTPPPPGRWLPLRTVRTVRIPLECILVLIKYTAYLEIAYLV